MWAVDAMMVGGFVCKITDSEEPHVRLSLQQNAEYGVHTYYSVIINTPCLNGAMALALVFSLSLSNNLDIMEQYLSS